ncbi:hypothetical protein G6F71_009535 [Rhizopus microsporus]|nr:hypothetical protein G6F71_009535 [Rhizopus microsporus]KAG1247140.1 hypothetical protein G6F68_014335 [Rhizopus microsporus]
MFHFSIAENREQNRTNALPIFIYRSFLISFHLIYNKTLVYANMAYVTIVKAKIWKHCLIELHEGHELRAGHEVREGHEIRLFQLRFRYSITT